MRRLSLVCALVFALPAIARARASAELSYRYEIVWATTIRLLRVDLRSPIEDRDQEMGFVLFDYVDRGRAYPGSVELVRFHTDRGDRVRVSIQVPSMPTYVSRMILDRLTRKLLEDYGEPPAPTPREDEHEDDDEEQPDETPRADRDDRTPERVAPRTRERRVADRNGRLPGERRQQRVIRE